MREKKEHRRTRTGRRLAGLLCCFALTLSMGFTAFGAELMVAVSEDSEGNALAAVGAVVLENEDSALIVTDGGLMTEEAELYVLLDLETGQQYELTNPEKVSGYNILLLDVEKGATPAKYHRALPGAVANQDVNLTFFNSNFEENSVKITLVEAQKGTSDIYSELKVDLGGENPKFYYPCFLLSEDGGLVGMYTSADEMVGLGIDLKEFYGTEDGRSGGLLGVAAFAAAAGITGFFIANKKKKQAAEAAASSSSASQPSQGNGVQGQAQQGYGAQGYASIGQASPGPAPYGPGPYDQAPKGPGYYGVTEPYKGHTAPPVNPASAPRILRANLVGIAGPMQGRTYPIAGEGLTMGRGNSCSIRFQEDTKGISRSHCRLYWKSTGQLMLEDCGSTYGTYLKGFGKLSPQQPVELTGGAVFYLGSDKIGFTVQK